MILNYNSLSPGRDTLLKKGIGDSVGSPPRSGSKTMSNSWLVMLLMLFAMTIGQVASAQSLANYTFASGTNGSLEDLSTGATTIMTGVNDDTGGTVTAIGFNFPFMGKVYTHFSANSNGQMLLHTSGTATAAASQQSSPSAGLAILAPMTGDNEVNNGIRIKVIGTSPNRKLVVEWNQFYVNFFNLTNAGNMQVWIEETTGLVTYMYGDIYNSASTSQTRSSFISSDATATTAGSITVAASPIFTLGTTLTVNTIAAGSGTTTGSPLIANLGSAANGSRRFYSFTPNVVAISGDASALTFTAVTLNTITPNWVDSSTNESFFVVTRALDAGFTTGVVTTNVASTTSAGTGTSYTLAQTGLSPGTTYFYKIQAANEVYFSTGVTGSQTTTAGTTYYWVGATGGTWGTAANWNTNPLGGGSIRTTPATSDVLIVDGAGFVAGGTMIIQHNVAAQTIGQLRVTSNTLLTIQSDLTTQRVITISGGGGDDFVIEAGSALSIANTANPISIVFTGTANTGLISGTLNVSGSSATASAANSFLTTGGTGTVVTVSSTGIINNNATVNITTNGNVTGSVATLVFANGAAYNVTGATTLAFWLPLATWGTTSTVTVSGITSSSTGPTNSNQSFGNFVYNCPLATATVSVFTSTTTAVIKGDLTITAGTTGGTGIFRALTSGTLNVNGNVNVLQGRFQSANGTGTLIVSGNTTVNANGIVDINAGTYSQRGTTFTNNGTLTGVSSTATLQFFSPTNIAQTFAGSGTVLTNVGAISVQNTSGLTITHTNQIPTLRVNLFNGIITNSNKITIGTGAALNTSVQIGYTGNILAGGSFDVAPIFNPGTGTHGVIYAQELGARTTGFEIPVSRSIAFLTNTNSNGVVIAGGPLATTLLTFNALSGGNITTTSANLLTVTGTATTSIVRTLATAYVNGPLAITLPASLAATTYTLPIGKGSLNPFALVGATTNAGGTVTVQAEVFDGAAGGTPGVNISSISTTRYWAASITAGAANFTSSFIQLNDTTTGRDAIAASTTQGGAYDIQGGPNLVPTGTSMTTVAPANTTLPGFFVMANKATPASFAGLAIAPAGNQCTNVSRTITVNVIPGAAAVSGVVINYAINGTAQTAITMTNTTGLGGLSTDTWSGTIPTVSPVNATVTWSVTATDANSITATQAGTTYKDEPLLAYAATATASVTTICGAGSSVLTATLGGTSNATIGTATTLTSATTQPTAFCNRWPSYRMQTVFTAAELTAAGLTAGNITAMSFNTTTLGDAATNSGFVVQIGTTALSVLSGAAFQSTTGYTTVFPSATFTHTASGLQTIPFSTPFVWDGTSNIIVDMVHNGANATNNAITYYTATAGNTVAYTTTASSNAPSYTTNRLNVVFAGNSSQPITSVSWDNGGGSGVTTTVSPTVTTTYTATITSGACTKTTNSVTVNVVPVPTAPAVNVTTATCGPGVPLVSVSDPNTFTTPTFKWYADNVTTTALQTSTSTTYTTSISATTTFYVSVINPSTGCESTRTAITATVNTPATIDPLSNQSVCVGGSFSATATSANASYSYTWTASPSAGSGITTSLTGASQTITPTAVGTYTYTVAASDGVCNNTTTFTATVNAYPTLTSASASPAAVCANGISTLTATVPSGLIFAASTGASLDPMTGAATVLGSSNDDTVTAAPVNIGFAFTLNGVSYTQYQASPDGWISLGATTGVNNFSNSMTSVTNVPRLAPMWDDLATGTTGNVTAVTTGITPNRILKVQWFVTSPRAIGSAANSTFQAWLYEGTNKIEYRYGTIGNPGSASGGYTISATNFSSITFAANSTSTVTANNSNAAAPVSGTMYTYTVPVSGNVTWGPLTDLYTDALATIPYTGTNAAVVYSKPTVTRTYNATLNGVGGCNTVSGDVIVTQNNEAVDAITGGASAICLGSPTIPASVQFISSVGVEWISSVPAVASIDSATGVLTPLTPGTTVISARIVNTTTNCTSYAPNTVSVNVYGPAVFTSNPANTSVLEYNGVDPTTATFSVVMSASSSVSGYQWQVSPTGANGSFVNVSGPEYSGANTATLTISNATSALNGLYYRSEVSTFSPCANPVYSSNGLLIVSDISICQNPTFTTPICGTGNHAFTVCVSSSSPYDVLWAYSDDAGANYNLIDGSPIGGLTFSGETTTTLQVNGISSANNNWLIIAVVSSGSASIESNPATIIVNQPQTVETTGVNAVQDVTICGNAVNSSTFTVTSSGGTGIQWQYSATNNGIDWASVTTATPTGATYVNPTGATLTVNSSALLGAGIHYYRALVAGPSGCLAIPSNVAQLTVTSPTITAVASVTTICGSGSSVLTASGAGVGGSYAWTASASLAAPLNSDTVTATPTVTTTYTVTGTTAAGCSSTATVTVIVAPSLAGSTATATPATVCLGTDSQLLATPITSGGSSLTYCGITVGFPGATSDFMSNFTFAGINHNSVDSPTDYIDNTNLVANVVAGAATPFSILPDPGFGQQYRIWIDFNKNGIFETTESVFNTTTSGTVLVNGSITVPTTALNGVTRMRIADRFSSAVAVTESCGHTGFGQYEDYSVNVTGGTADPNSATYTYSWSPSTFLSATNIANPIATAVTATTAYTVTITSSTGCSTTKNVTVTLASGISIVGHPQNASFCQGATASLSVGASGADLTYQWRKDGVELFGEISSSITIPSATPANSGSYDVVINSICGDPAVTSNPAILTINATPTVNSVSAQTVCPGTTSVIALSGTPATGLTFNISGGAAIGLANVTGVSAVPSFTATAGSATISVTPVANGCTGTATTFVYTVNATPATPTVGSNSPVCEGSAINLTATVSIPGYSMNASSGIAYNDISGTGTNVPLTPSTSLADDSEHAITIPAFTYNGVSYTTALVGNNGALAFGLSTGNIGFGNTTLPTAISNIGGGTGAGLFPLWDDLTPGAGASIKTQTTGSITTIQWTNEDNFGATGTGTVTFQVQLDSSNGKIHFVYPDVLYGVAGFDNGQTATVGIQLNSTTAVQYSFNTASLVNGQSITFSPNVASYAWTGPNGFTSTLQNPSLTATALTAGVYSVKVTNVATGCESAAATTTVVVDTPVTYYSDADGDGFGNPAITAMSCTGAPVGFVANNTDCNPADGTKWQTGLFYVDADGDAYTVGSQVTLCYGASTPAGYSATSLGTDCDDSDATKFQSNPLYTDADGDGYTVGAAVATCYGATVPTGYSLTTLGTDCDDTNALLTNNCAPTNTVVNLNLFIEGYYSFGSEMNSVKLNQGVEGASALDVEDIMVELRDPVTLELVGMAVATLHTNGTATATFSTAISGSYYIAILTSNAVQTWSAAPVTVGATPASYNFTTGSSQAYGDNMVEVEPGVWALFSGEIDGDGNVDNVDFAIWASDANDFAFGVFDTDLNGDGNVDNSDFAIWATNANNFVSIIIPTL